MSPTASDASDDFAGLEIRVPQIEWEGRPWTYRQRLLLAPPDSLLAEADLYGPRWAMVTAFADANEVDRIEVPTREAWLGIVAVGAAYDTVCDALGQLGVGPDRLAAAGIRICASACRIRWECEVSGSSRTASNRCWWSRTRPSSSRRRFVTSSPPVTPSPTDPANATGVISR